MTLLTEKGTFTNRTTTGAQEINLAGAFQPKALIMWSSSQTTTDGTYADDALLCYGFSDGTNDACVSYQMDESAESETYRFDNANVLFLQSASLATFNNVATVNSFDADGFTLGWTIGNATAFSIHYIAIGGTDITNVQVVNTTVGDTSTGNHSYNGSGTSFQPDFALTLTAADGSTINTTSGGADLSLVCLGAAKSTSEQFVVWGRDETVGTSDCDMYINNAACLASCSNTTGAITFLADFVSFNNAAGGGITVNISDASPAAAKPIAFLLIKGGSWDCGTFQQRSGTGTQDVTTTTGLTSKGVFLAGIGSATAGSVQANFYLGMGASDGTNEGCSYTGNTNGLGTFAAVRSNLTTKVYRQATPNATAASSTTDAECDMSSMATAGQFTLDWTTADTVQRQMAYWTVGTLAAGNNVVRTMDTETITISEVTKARLAAKMRPLTAQTTTISEVTKTRLASKMRPLATQTVTMSEPAPPARVRSKARALPTETITIDAGTLARLKSSMRALSAETTTIGAGTVARLKAALRSLATETITISEDLQRTVTLGGQAIEKVLEETVTIAAGTAARLKAATRTLDTETNTIEAGTLARLKANIRALSTETTEIAPETLARAISKIRSVATEVSSIIESPALARLATKMRTLATETITLTEDLQRTVSTGQQNIVKTLEETVSVAAGTLARLKAASRALDAETITITAGTLARLKASMRALADETTTIAAGSVARLIGKVRALTEDTLESPILARLSAKMRALSTETIGISDAVEQTVSAIQYEIILISDQVTRTVSHANNIVRALETESISITAGTLSRLKAAQRALDTENITILAGTLARLATKIRALATETTTISAGTVEQLVSSGQQAIEKALSDTITIAAGTLSRLTQKIRIIEDLNTVFSEILEAYKNGIRLVPPQPPDKGGITVPYKRVQAPRIKQIRYPVFYVPERFRLERRRKLREEIPRPVLIPAFQYNIHRVIAPFTVINVPQNAVNVRFALKTTQNRVIFAGKALPVQLPVPAQRVKLQKASCPSFVMQQGVIERYGRRLHKMQKLLALFFLAEQMPK